MIVHAQAPCRISLFGGGTDVEPFVSEYGSVIISLAITLRQYITLYTGDHMWGHIRDTFPYQAYPQFIYDIYHKFGYSGGHVMKLKVESDAYLKSGLGSSAAGATAALMTIIKAKGIDMDPADMVVEAHQAETAQGWYGGIQDQIASVYGGMNVIEIGGKYGTEHKVFPFVRNVADRLVSSMVLFYLGERQEEKIQEKLRKPTAEQTKALQSIRDSVVGSLDYLQKGDIERIGKLMDIAWTLKKRSNPFVSNEKIDHIYKKGKLAGAFGGKVLGAGSGGHILFIIDPRNRKEFLQKMEQYGMENIDFDIDWQGATGRVISE